MFESVKIQPQSPLLPRGVVFERCHKDDPELCYYLYLPCKNMKNPQIFVAVHGISRNASEQAYCFAELAERYGVILVAPRFGKEAYPGYQRLGRSSKVKRADRALERILAEVAQLTGAPEGPCAMFGFSGGGQFVHRYAMAYPHRVTRIALGAPGWYTFPDPTQRFPWGIKSSRQSRLGFAPSRFLRNPACVLVGEKDNLRDDDLNKSPRIDAQQGCDRLERGFRWVQAMVAATRACNLNAHYTFEILPDSDHSFSSCIKNGGLDKRVFTFLFGEPPGKPAKKFRFLPEGTCADETALEKSLAS